MHLLCICQEPVSQYNGGKKMKVEMGDNNILILSGLHFLISAQIICILSSFSLCKDNDFPTEMRAFNIKAKKRDLGKAKREIRKKVAELKEVMTLQGQIFKLDQMTLHSFR